MKITHVYHKKNEKFEIEFFQDKECTESFHFKDKENLYIELRDGDVTPLLALKNAVATWIKIYTPYLWKQFKYQEPLNKITTLEDITPDFSKYIPKDSVVLFLSQAKGRKYGRAMGLNWFYWFYWFNQDDDSIDCQFISHSSVSEEETEDEKKLLEDFYNLPTNDYSMFKNITLFIPEINSQNIEQLNNIAKELKEKYNVEWVGLCVRDCFQCIYEDNIFSGSSEKSLFYKLDGVEYNFSNFDKLITTNSTGILEPQDTEQLKVVDWKEWFRNVK